MEDLLQSFLNYQYFVSRMVEKMKDIEKMQKEVETCQGEYDEIKAKKEAIEKKKEEAIESLNGQIAQAMKDGDSDTVVRLVRKRGIIQNDNRCRDDEGRDIGYKLSSAENRLKEAKDNLQYAYNYDKEVGLSKLQAEIFECLSPAEIECFKREGILVKDTEGTAFYMFPNFNFSDIQSGFREEIKKNKVHYNSCSVNPYRRYLRDKNGFEIDYPSGTVYPERENPYFIEIEPKSYEFVYHRHQWTGYNDSRAEQVIEYVYTYKNDWLNYVANRLPVFLKGAYAKIYATMLEAEGKDLLRRADQVRAWAQEYGVQESADESEG